MRVLETDRLKLRWFGEHDAALVLELMNEPSWIANIGDRGLRTVEDARAWIASKFVTSYWHRGHGLWAVERKSDGVLVGMCGLLERDTLPHIDVGYALFPRFCGQGYAREATRACLEYGRDILGKRRILAIVWPKNGPSIRVLESVGMVALGERLLPGEEAPSAVFARGESADEAAKERDPQLEIDDLVRRFFRAFSNRDGLATIASVPSLFLPEAVVTIVKPAVPRGLEVVSVRDFVVPRAELLQNGRVTDFGEEEVSSKTEILGHLAQRSTHYRKAGNLDGVPFAGGGEKRFQLVLTKGGWKIAALAWEDT